MIIWCDRYIYIYIGIHKGTESTRHRAFPIGHHRLTGRSRRDFIGAYTQLHTSLGVFSEPCACVPGHPVIFPDDHLVVQSLPKCILFRFHYLSQKVIGSLGCVAKSICLGKSYGGIPQNTLLPASHRIYLDVTRQKKSTGDFWPFTHRIHGIGYIYLHLVEVYGKCRKCR